MKTDTKQAAGDVGSGALLGRPMCIECRHYRCGSKECARVFANPINGAVDFPYGVNVWQARRDYCGIAGDGFEPNIRSQTGAADGQ